MVSRYRDWLRQSERNIASIMVNYSEGIYGEACFQSHQSAEKALKASLNYLHKERRSRSPLFLISEVSVDIPEGIKECILDLDKHYISSRYSRCL